MNDRFFYVVTVKNNNLKLIETLNVKALGEFDCQGVEELNLDEGSIDHLFGKKSYIGAEISDDIFDTIESLVSSLKYYFYDENKAQAFFDYLKPQGIEASLEKAPWKDWNEQWKKNFRPLKISSALTVVPVLEDSSKPERKKGEVLIYPGMGFGTGTHETTYLCLKFFLDLIDEGFSFKNCLDFGCGSGILGIATKKTLDRPVVFCDIDKLALDNCYKNLYLNFSDQELSGCVLCHRDKLKIDQQFDLIYANILEVILLKESELLKGLLSTQGYLIVSGLLVEQVDHFLDAFDPGENLELVGSKKKGDWASVLFRKKL
jgi:ribosomal protein L11 methyltransferase